MASKKEKLPKRYITDEKYKLIKEDLEKQLRDNNKYGKQYDDILTHAVFLFMLKDNLQDDIDLKGLRFESMTGNGYKKEEDNKSVDKLLKVSAQLMKLLLDLGLKEPSDEGDVDDLL